MTCITQVEKALLRASNNIFVMYTKLNIYFLLYTIIKFFLNLFINFNIFLT